MAEGRFAFTAGAVLTAAQLKDYLMDQAVQRYADASARNTAVSTVLTEGLVTLQKDVNSITVYTGSAWSTVGPLYGGGTSFTPTVTQSGGVTITLNNSTYFRLGRLVVWTFAINITGSGTGANDVSLSIPVASAYGGSNYAYGGTGEIFDASASLQYTGLAVLTGASTMKIRSGLSSSAPASGYLGTQSFTAGLAAGDIISGQVIYEAASDA